MEPYFLLIIKIMLFRGHDTFTQLLLNTNLVFMKHKNLVVLAFQGFTRILQKVELCFGSPPFCIKSTLLNGHFFLLIDLVFHNFD